MSHRIPERLVRPAPALLGGAGAIFLVLIVVYSRPIADDWSALTFTRHAGFAGTVNSSGRYSAQALAWMVVRLFGGTAIQITPLVVLAAGWAAASWALACVARSAGIRAPAWELVLLALMSLVACLSVAPSLIDNIGWFSGVGGYTTALSASTLLAAWCWHLAGAGGRRPVLAVAAAVAAMAGAFIIAGFHELAGGMLVPASILALLTARALRPDRTLLATIAAAGLGGGIGLTVNLLNPATRARATNLHARIDLVGAARTAWHDLSFLYGPIHSGRVLLPIATGIVAWQLLGPAITPRVRAWMGAWAAFLIVIPWVVVSAGCAWANATESGDRAPFRAAFLFTSPAALAVALLVAIGLSLRPRLLTQTSASLLALIVTAGGLVALGHKAQPLIRAERMRIHALSLRAAAVERQLAAGSRDIVLTPAPLLTVDTQAYDLSFAPTREQRGWIVGFLRSYYAIPRADSVTVVARQPHDYCLPNVAAPWVGVKSCQELR